MSLGRSVAGRWREELRALRIPEAGHTFFLVTADPHARLRDQVLNNVLEGPGETDPGLRGAAADGRGLPGELQALVDKIHRHAYKVTDDDLARLRGKYPDDQLFEIVVSAALGASRNRLRAGLEALESA